jgi:hypothetical protein
MKFLKRLFCAHVYVWERNWADHLLHLTGGARSTWRCKFCNKIVSRDFPGEQGRMLA